MVYAPYKLKRLWVKRKTNILRRIYEPDKNETKLDEAITQLYLLKHALEVDSTEKIQNKINDIRSMLIEVKENFHKD